MNSNLLENYVCNLNHNCQKDIIPFFDQKDGIVVCNNICGLMSPININHNPDWWRLFVYALTITKKRFKNLPRFKNILVVTCP